MVHLSLSAHTVAWIGLMFILVHKNQSLFFNLVAKGMHSSGVEGNM